MLPLIVANVAIDIWKINSDKQDKRIQDALRIMRHVLETRKDVPNVMYRNNIGVIGFRYGAHYPATKTRKRSGYGLAHIVGSAKEDFGKYEGSPAPEDVLKIIPETILEGTISRSHKRRLQIMHKGYLVLIDKGGKSPKAPRWVFHAYKLYK